MVKTFATLLLCDFALKPPADFAGILSDVLEEVLAMTEENWQEKAEALAELLRPLVPR